MYTQAMHFIVKVKPRLSFLGVSLLKNGPICGFCRIIALSVMLQDATRWQRLIQKSYFVSRK